MHHEYHTSTLIFFDSVEVYMLCVEQRWTQMGIMCAGIVLFVLCMTCLVAVAEDNTTPISSNLIELDLPMSPYCAVTTRIYGDATLTINGKKLHDRDHLQIFEDEEVTVSVHPEYGFHLISLEFEGEALIPISSTTYKGDIHKDGTLRAVLTRWNNDIPVTFSITSPYQVKVYGTEVQDQQTIYCYPHEILELVIDTPPNTAISGNISGKKLKQIDAQTYTVPVTEAGTLYIKEYDPAEEEEQPLPKFLRPRPIITPPFIAQFTNRSAQ